MSEFETWFLHRQRKLTYHFQEECLTRLSSFADLPEIVAKRGVC
jgi:hypothetical protein